MKCLNRFHNTYNKVMKRVAKFVGEIYFLKSLTKTALLYNYCKPVVRHWSDNNINDGTPLKVSVIS